MGRRLFPVGKCEHKAKRGAEARTCARFALFLGIGDLFCR